MEYIEFNNALVDCKQSYGYLLDIYREITVAIEDYENHQVLPGPGVEMAISQAKKAGAIDESTANRLERDWKEVSSPARHYKGGFDEVYDLVGKLILENNFKCFLKALDKLPFIK